MNDAFVADLHLSNATYGGLDKDGLSFRTKDFLGAFNWAVEQVLSLQSERLFILGDVYETPNPPSRIRRRFKAKIRQLAAAGVKVEILVGNHDAGRHDNALEPILEANFTGVQVHYQPTVIESAECIYLVYPHCEPVERQEISLRAHFIETVRHWQQVVNRDGRAVVLVGHIPVFGAQDSEGHTHENEDALRLEDLALVESDFMFLGDFHAHQKLTIAKSTSGNDCQAYYVGSLERASFRDLFVQKHNEMVPGKGLMTLRGIKGSKPLATFVENPNIRPMHKLGGDAAELEKQIDALGDVNGGIVKLCFAGTVAQAKAFDAQRDLLKKKLSVNNARLVLVEEHVSDPKRDAQAAQLRRDIHRIDEIGSSDIEEVIETTIKTLGDNEEEAHAAALIFRDIVTAVGEKRKAAGIVSGTLRLHGIKLHNVFRYGVDHNVVEFSRGAAEILNHSIAAQWEVELRAKRAKELLAQWSADTERKMLSVMGMIDGDPDESNGSGKSTIPEGITYAFFEKTVRDFAHKVDREKGKTTTSIVSKINGVYANEAFVELLFSVDDTLWLLKRGRKMKKVKHEAILQVTCLAAPEDVEQGSRSGTLLAGDEELIAELVGMTYDTFCNSTMFGQFDAGQFIFGTHSIRQGIIINVLRLGIITRYLAEVRDRRKVTASDLDALQVKLDTLAPTADQDPVALQKEIDRLQKLAADLDVDITKAEVAANSFRQHSDVSLHEVAKNALVLCENAIADHGRTSATTRDSLVQQREAAIARRATSQGEVDEQARLRTDAEGKIAKLTGQIAAFDQAAVGSGLVLVAQAKAVKSERQSQLILAQEARTRWISERSRLEGSRLVAEAEVHSVRVLLEQSAGGQAVQCPHCRSSVTKDHLQTEVSNYDSTIATSKTTESELSIKVAAADKKIEELQGRLSRIDACLATETALTAANQAVANQRLLLEQAKSTATTVTTAEKRFSDQVEEFKSEVSKLDKNIAEHDAQQSAQLNILQKQLSEAKSKAEGLEIAAQDALSKAEAAGRALKMLRQEKEQAIADESRVQTVRQAVEAAREQQAAVTAQHAVKTKEIDRLNLLDRLLGPDGIQTSIVERYIPLLNSYLQEYLSAVSGNRMRAEVLTDGKREGKVDIWVSGGDCSEDATNVSGGESVKLRMALDIALGLLSFARSRNAPDFICLDEVLAPVDRRTKVWVLEMLQRLQDRFRMVLCISHDEALQQKLKHTILVNKVNGISRIEKQWWEPMPAIAAVPAEDAVEQSSPLPLV